jgi:hypothetical protein
MPKTMLITLPDFDVTVSYVSAWSEEIIRTAEKNGIKTVPVRGDGVTRSHVTSDIKSKNPSFIAFNGHGSETCIAGQNNEPLITLGENDRLLDSRIIHALTCSSASGLGRGCKASAFIGYDGIFWLYMDNNKISRPLSDMKVRPILESAMEAPRQIAKGESAGNAYAKSQETYQRFIDHMTLSSSEHTAEELQVILPFLHSNKGCQKIFGDREARI